MRDVCHTRKIAAVKDAAANNGDRLRAMAAERDSHDLKLALNAAIKRQAKEWGIRFDQTRALLLDRKAIA